jgi:spore maturation protein CgeB
MTQHPWFWPRFERTYFDIRYRFSKIIDFPYEMVLYRDIKERLKEFRPDVVLLHFIHGSYYSFLIRRLRELGIPLLAWCGVHPSGKEPPVPEGVMQAYRMTDCVLYYDPAYEPLFRKRGFRRLHRFPFGIDFNVYDSVEPDDTLKEEGLVSFIGQIDKIRGEYLRELSSFPLGIWTYDRENLKRESLENHYKGDVSGTKQIMVMKSASAVINVHRKLEISGGNYRLFEINASKACQLVDYRPGIKEYFVPEQEVVTFKDRTELRAKAKQLLDDPDMRNAIAEAGYRRAKKDHSIENRSQTLVDIIKGL